MTSTLAQAPSRSFKPSAHSANGPRHRPQEQPSSRPIIRSSNVPKGTDRHTADKPLPKSTKHPDTPPPSIAADERQLAVWRDANEDERLIAVALCDLGCRIQADGIESYFRFGDFWNARYPKEDGKNYQRGMNAVAKGASMSPYGVSQVYTVLKTIQVYSRTCYEELREKAMLNGVILTWTNLRTIATRLGKSELRVVRRAVEKQLVTKKMTTKQLNALIDELAPQTVRSRETSDEHSSAKTRIASLITSFKRNANQYQEWLTAIAQYEDEFQGDDPKEVKKTLEQVRTTLEEFERMEKFLREGRPILETLREQVAFLADSDPDTVTKQTERIAGAVKKRIATDKRQEQVKRRRQSDQVQLSGEFADDDDEPHVVFRTGDEYRPRASAHGIEGDEGEYADTEDDDEFDPDEDTEEFDPDEDEFDPDEDEWDDDVLDDEDDSIFSEIDDISDDDVLPVRKR